MVSALILKNKILYDSSNCCTTDGSNNSCGCQLVFFHFLTWLVKLVKLGFNKGTFLVLEKLELGKLGIGELKVSFGIFLFRFQLGYFLSPQLSLFEEFVSFGR